MGWLDSKQREKWNRNQMSAAQKMQNLCDALAEDILNMTDEEIRIEMIEDGITQEEVDRSFDEALTAARAKVATSE